MKRFTAAFAFAGLLAASATAQDAVLRTATQSEYAESLAALIHPLDQDAANTLILKLVSLAIGPVPAGKDPIEFLQEGTAQISARPELLLQALKPYEGMTVPELMAATP